MLPNCTAFQKGLRCVIRMSLGIFCPQGLAKVKYRVRIC